MVGCMHKHPFVMPQLTSDMKFNFLPGALQGRMHFEFAWTKVLGPDVGVGVGVTL